MAFISGIIIGIISAMIFAIFSFTVKSVRTRILKISEEYRVAFSSGLRGLHPRTHLPRPHPFEIALKKVSGQSELLIVSRTARRLLEEKKSTLLKAVQNGCHVKILILDLAAVKGGLIDYAPLQLKFTTVMPTDLMFTIQLLSNMCRDAVIADAAGSIELRTTTSLIFNSLTSWTTDARDVILDFSFSEDNEDKYQLIFKAELHNNLHFVNKLYNHYKQLYERGKHYISYSNERIKKSISFVQSEIKSIDEQYNDSEYIRGNSCSNLIHHSPEIFKSIDSGTMSSPAPLSVQLEVTNRCNTACTHCKRHRWPQNTQELSTDGLCRIIDDLKRYVKTITLSGGEPTQREDLPELLRTAKSGGISIGMLTNALKLDSEMMKALVTNCDWIRVSLDASNPDTYQGIRGTKGGFSAVVENIKKMTTMSQELNTDCKIGICYTIQRTNIKDVQNMVSFVHNLGLNAHERLLTFKFAHGENGFLCSSHDLVKFRTDIHNIVATGMNETNNLDYMQRFLTEISNIDDISRGSPMEKYYRSRTTKCFCPYIFTLIDASGDVYPCCFLYYDNYDFQGHGALRNEYLMGSLRNGGLLSDVWNSKAYIDFRQATTTVNIEKYAACKECTRHYLHNAFLTDLYNKVWKNTEDTIYTDAATSYAPSKLWL
jgi:radical SAM protein with 4Fe4S-binding SPASM domain